MGPTIYALSTPPGRGGVAVVRVTGPLSRALIESLTGQPCPPPRYAALRRLGHTGREIDRGLVLFFAAPASFTGEDMAEFQVHGGKAVVQALGQALEALGARPAAPGDFTKTAFLNGKLDLVQAEAVADLIDAETSCQQAQALAQAEGGLSRLYEGWRETLLQNLAWLEAMLDFPDEDLPADLWDRLQRQIAELAAELTAHLDDARRGERLRQGIKIAILGAPNAGKSSLLNALAHRDVAIVSARAGTTRDVIEVNLDLGGYPVIVADTAGLRETGDDIEQQGIDRAMASAAEADLKLLLFDATLPLDAATLAWADDTALIVRTKADLLAAPLAEDSLLISTAANTGIDKLLAALTGRVASLFADRSTSPPTRERHRHHLQMASEALRRFTDLQTPDLAAEDLRIALTALGRITGRVDVEELLDVIFRDFCIGK
jgi:tRNA modification GTPase